MGFWVILNVDWVLDVVIVISLYRELGISFKFEVGVQGYGLGIQWDMGGFMVWKQFEIGFSFCGFKLVIVVGLFWEIKIFFLVGLCLGFRDFVYFGCYCRIIE